MEFINTFTSQIIILFPFIHGGSLNYTNLTYQLDQDENEVFRIISNLESGQGETLCRCLKQYAINVKKLANLVRFKVKGIKKYARSLYLRKGPRFSTYCIREYKIRKAFNWSKKEFDKFTDLWARLLEWYFDFHDMCQTRNLWFYNIDLKLLADLAYSGWT